MKFDIGLTPLEALCALGGLIGFFAAVVQIWEFIERRPHLSKLLVRCVRASLTLATLSIFVIAFISFAPALRGKQGPDIPRPGPVVGPVASQPPTPAPRPITRWAVVVPNNVAKGRYRNFPAAAIIWSRSVGDADLVTMVNFADKGLVTPLEDVAGRLARTDLPQLVAAISTFPRGSIEDAVRKADDFLGRPNPDRREVVVVLSDTDPRGFAEVDRPSIAQSGPTGDRGKTIIPAVAGLGDRAQ